MRLGANSWLLAAAMRKALLTLAVVSALLLGVAIYVFRPVICFNRDGKLRADFMALDQSLTAFHNLNGFYPTTDQGLISLVALPTVGPRPPHWYQLLRKVPKDPYHNQYVYTCLGNRNPQGYDLLTKGRDGVANTADDIGEWERR